MLWNTFCGPSSSLFPECYFISLPDNWNIREYSLRRRKTIAVTENILLLSISKIGVYLPSARESTFFHLNITEQALIREYSLIEGEKILEPENILLFYITRIGDKSPFEITYSHKRRIFFCWYLQLVNILLSVI